MVTDRLMNRLGSEPILSISVNLMVTVTETVRVKQAFNVKENKLVTKIIRS